MKQGQIHSKIVMDNAKTVVNFKRGKNIFSHKKNMKNPFFLNFGAKNFFNQKNSLSGFFIRVCYVFMRNFWALFQLCLGYNFKKAKKRIISQFWDKWSPKNCYLTPKNCSQGHEIYFGHQNSPPKEFWPLVHTSLP